MARLLCAGPPRPRECASWADAVHWHAEVTFELAVLTGPGRWLRVKKLTIRGYDEADGYARHIPFKAILQADVYQVEERAFLHGMLRIDGGDLRRQDYRGIAKLLRLDHGVSTACADRHGEEVAFDMARWAA